jgi:hypothetical protein
MLRPVQSMRYAAPKHLNSLWKGPLSACSVHAQCMLSACLVYAQCMLSVCSAHHTYVPLRCTQQEYTARAVQHTPVLLEVVLDNGILS